MCAENYNISFGESVRTWRPQLEATRLLINAGVVSRERGLRTQLLIVDKILDEIESGACERAEQLVTRRKIYANLFITSAARHDPRGKSG